jgi:hypothetical protein
MKDPNPYEVSRESMGSGASCMRCGGHSLVRTDARFPRYTIVRCILYGWAVLLVRYAFVMPVDTCPDCGARFYYKPTGSLLVMILLISLAILATGLVG